MTYDVVHPHWSLLTKSRGGTVSIMRGLTLGEAKNAYERLDPDYGRTVMQFAVHKDFLPNGSGWRGHTSDGRLCQDGDIVVREVFGPPGWEGLTSSEMRRWPKFITIYEDADGNILSDEYQEDIEAAQRAREQREIIQALREDCEQFQNERNADASTYREPVKSWLARLFEELRPRKARSI